LSGNAVNHLAEWYSRQCDGDWEHEYGIEITTLDNPGWLIRVDLKGTELEGLTIPRAGANSDDGPWLDYHADGEVFIGTCDVRSLPLLLAKFQELSHTGRDAGGPR
jgi:hypothetical protein